MADINTARERRNSCGEEELLKLHKDTQLNLTTMNHLRNNTLLSHSHLETTAKHMNIPRKDVKSRESSHIRHSREREKEREAMEEEEEEERRAGRGKRRKGDEGRGGEVQSRSTGVNTTQQARF